VPPCDFGKSLTFLNPFPVLRMAFIEAELAKKRGVDPTVAAAAAKSLDPRDELYRVAEKYKFADVEEKVKTKQDKEEEEGNITLSTGMLMGIPEVDLGIEYVSNFPISVSLTDKVNFRAYSIKLKNIEDTEKAKRNLYDSQVAAAKKAEQDREEFAVERCEFHLSLLSPLLSRTDPHALKYL